MSPWSTFDNLIMAMAKGMGKGKVFWQGGNGDGKGGANGVTVNRGNKGGKGEMGRRVLVAGRPIIKKQCAGTEESCVICVARPGAWR